MRSWPTLVRFVSSLNISELCLSSNLIKLWKAKNCPFSAYPENRLTTVRHISWQSPLIIFSHLPDWPILTAHLPLCKRKVLLLAFETLSDLWDLRDLPTATAFLLSKASPYLTLDLFWYNTLIKKNMWKTKSWYFNLYASTLFLNPVLFVFPFHILPFF